MKRISTLCVLFLALSPVAFSQELPKPPANPPGAQPAAKPPVKIAGLGQERRELTWQECIRLSLSTVNAVAAAVELNREGVITPDTDRAITSAWVLDRLAAKHPDIEDETPEFIDRIREFIEANYRFIFRELKRQGTE